MYFTWKKITANDCAFQIHFFFIQTFENGVIVGWRKMGGGDVRGQNVIVFMILFMATLLLRITIKCLSEDTLDTKVSFFWDQSQDISSRGFPPKIQASDWLTYLFYQLEVGNNLNSCLDSDLRKNWLWHTSFESPIEN